jgi:hypothetical protein
MPITLNKRRKERASKNIEEWEVTQWRSKEGLESWRRSRRRGAKAYNAQQRSKQVWNPEKLLRNQAFFDEKSIEENVTINRSVKFDPGQLDRNTFDGDCKIKRRPSIEAPSLNIHSRISGSALSNHIFVLGSKIFFFKIKILMLFKFHFRFVLHN